MAAWLRIHSRARGFVEKRLRGPLSPTLQKETHMFIGIDPREGVRAAVIVRFINTEARHGQ